MKTFQISAISAMVMALGAASVASAISDFGTMQGAYVGGNITQTISGLTAGSSTVGALGHRFSAPSNTFMTQFTNQGANQTVYAFCIDSRNVTGASTTFTARYLTDAPIDANGNAGNPGSNYTADNERRANAIMIAARQLGLVDSRGFFIPSAGADAAAAIALLVWESVWDETGSAIWDLATAEGAGTIFRVNNYATNVSPGVQSAVNSIVGVATGIFNNVNTPILVRAITTDSINAAGDHSAQDQIVLIPLPPAAWAGLGTLGGALGLAYVRRRKHTIN